jgi:hypothetical protein
MPCGTGKSNCRQRLSKLARLHPKCPLWVISRH